MSLLPKIDEIRVFTEAHSIDLFFIKFSETLLKSNVGMLGIINISFLATTLNVWTVEFEFMGTSVCFPTRNIKHPVYMTWSVRIWKLCGFMYGRPGYPEVFRA